MIEIPEPSPCYLTTNRSANCARAGHVPRDSLAQTLFQNPSLRAFGAFGAFAHELPTLLAGLTSATCSEHGPLPSPQPGISRLAARRVNEPNFGSVTKSELWLPPVGRWVTGKWPERPFWGDGQVSPLNCSWRHRRRRLSKCTELFYNLCISYRT